MRIRIELTDLYQPHESLLDTLHSHSCRAPVSKDRGVNLGTTGRQVDEYVKSVSRTCLLMELSGDFPQFHWQTVKKKKERLISGSPLGPSEELVELRS